MKSDFWRVDQDEFAYKLYDSMCDCTMSKVNNPAFYYYDYASQNPKKIGAMLSLQIKGTPPIRFDLGAFKASAKDAIDEYESRPNPAHDTYVQNKTELETGVFALTPPAITVIPPDRRVYGHLSPLEQPMVLRETSYGQVCSLRRNGKEKYEGDILHRLGHHPYYVNASTLNDWGRKIDLTCYENMPLKSDL